MPRTEAEDLAAIDDDSLEGRRENALELLAPYPSLLLAVSGGPDSVALMLLCAEWSLRSSRHIAVATVDHGLRKDARMEAEEVGRWARALGYDHHLLTWEGEKPSTRLQERARRARYALLSACARRIGASAIVLAHHSEDQAETILFRLTRGSGVAGLAGMARVARCADITLLRPLLDFRKEALEAVCARADQPFFRDPSNEDESFARVRLRRLSPMLAAQGLGRDALLRLGSRAARADAALAHCAAEMLTRALQQNEASCIELDAATLCEAPLEILQRVLASAILRIAPAAVLRLERLERASARVAAALAAHGSTRMTLADVSIEANGGRIWLRPAPPRRSSLT
ncbi:tRNA lysidine(34) synthetase TilS [Methylocystis sp.]|uniref:tRNA lysidine(34) synthetase TilS n=1 Tax=Methylocystis sp. TaxID=1911079 RepID=UPI002734CCD2|nr:tRNA lysidine(34) synthetase TilS [Methylocystis sp.]MDP3552962.1 tRNA lysidine(34) synthetase TilS [Methylocystis sp.]